MADHLFADAELFIIFACSLGATDGWWWRRILERLDKEPAGAQPRGELVIYWWTKTDGAESSRHIVERFFVGADVEPADPIRQCVRDQIQVVACTDETPPVWLAT